MPEVELERQEHEQVFTLMRTAVCICKQNHNTGLMVQCDKCEVWQHCSCMGLQAEKLPEQYYCELCRSDFHQLIKNPNGR
ncbi:hypothetical protein RMATCC62417_10918 [Rhizopus microsporus]|nr:hypothetical protein RMATCC62417_10918 [Rhizopus microsporus]